MLLVDHGKSNRADLTHYESYPAPGSSECEDYSGCEYEGLFAFLDDKKSEEWVQSHNIIAVHEKDSKYALKTFRITQGEHVIQAKVYDKCSDSDCNGCCSTNAANTGFLIDMEINTYNRWGGEDGVVEWQCIDC